MSKFFDGGRLIQQLKYVNEIGLAQARPYWNFGQFQRLNRALPTLRSGLWYHVSPENIGKSQFQINLGWQILSSSEDTYWLDFTLDDTIEQRFSYLLARVGNMPINLVLQAGNAEEEERETRRKAFSYFTQNFRTRYRVEGLTSNPEVLSDTPRFTAEWVCRHVVEARQAIGPEAKLWVTIDGFHDLDLEERISEENERQKRKSEVLRFCANDHDALFMMTAHPRKDSRRRGMTADILKGDDAPLMHARVITHLFSDVNLNRDNAVVYWEDPTEADHRLPVHEVDILKNKAGGFKGVLFYNFDPRRCLDFEVDEDQQQMYRGMIYVK